MGERSWTAIKGRVPNLPNPSPRISSKRSGRRGKRPLQPTRVALARGLSCLRFVRCRSAGDVQQVLDAGHAWGLEDGPLDRRDAEGVIDRTANGHDAMLHVEVDLTLRHFRITEDLALHPIAQRQVVLVNWRLAGLDAHHALLQPGRGIGGVTGPTIDRLGAVPQSRARPVDEDRAT